MAVHRKTLPGGTQADPGMKCSCKQPSISILWVLTATERVRVVSSTASRCEFTTRDANTGVHGTSSCHECHGDKSGRSELATNSYATHNSHPFSCLLKKAPHAISSAGGFPEARAGSSYFFVLSTLLPITPPRIAPAAPPIIAPFTLRPATAPITAPAPAPIAASRLVCLTTTGAGAGAL